MLLMSHIDLVPDLQRLKEILDTDDHPLFTPNPVPEVTLTPETLEYLKKARKAQVGALVRTINVILKTQEGLLDVHKAGDEEKKRAVDAALANLFGEDKGQS